MTEIPAETAEPTPPPSPVRSRRRLIVGIAAATVAVVVAVVGVLFAVTALNADRVALYTSEAENYSVMAPGEPTPKQDDYGMAITTTATHWTHGELYYSVSSTEGRGLPPSQRGLYLLQVLTGALTDAPGVDASALDQATVMEAFQRGSQDFTLSGDPAILTSITVDGAPAPFKVIVAGHGDNLYMVVLSESADSGDEDFIESFEYLD